MQDSRLKQYLYHFEFARRELRDLETWSEHDRRIGKAHFAYLKKATEDGTVILVGRSTDGIGPALVIFEAEAEQDARLFMQSDPFVSNGLMRATLHPFNAALVRGVRKEDS